MSKKIATFKDLDTLASLDTGTSAGYISGAENEQCVTKGNFDTVSTKTIAAKGNGLMFVDGSESSKYESNRLILLDDVQYISEITAVLVSAPNIPAKGGSSYATWKLTQSYKVNGDASPSVIEWNVTGSVVEASSKGTTISTVTNVANSTTTVTKNGKSITLSQMIKQDLNKMVSLSGTTSTFSYDSKVGAGGGSVSPTLNGNGGTVTFSSNSTLAASSCEGYTYTRTWSATNSGLWTLNTSNGKMTATSKGTNISNETSSMTVTSTGTCKVVNPASVGGDTLTKSATATAKASQLGNYVTKVEPKPSSGTAHVKYADISAGGTTSSPQGTGVGLYTFSSGSTTTDSSSSPSFGGSASYTRTYVEKANSDASNAFSVATTGTVTTSHRGTTPGAARSVTVTATLVLKYTHDTGMSAPNASVSGTLVNDVVVTQLENKITSYGSWTTPTVTVEPNSFVAAGGTATITISGDCTRENTWSSGSKTTDTAYKSNKSASFATISSDYKTLTVGVNTTGSNRTGNVYIDWSFESDNNVVKSVVSNGYSQIGQSDCTLTLTGSIKVYHETATIIGKASVAGTIYWGTSQTSMTQSTIVSANVDTTITNRTSLGTTTIYAYFVPTDTNYKTLGSSSAYHASASAKITQASDANITITTTSNKTYNGSAQTVVTCDSTTGTHGVSTWALGYATSSSATANSGVTWIADKTNLSLTNAGTYYIWRRWTADGNHSNSNSGEKIDATVTISKKAVTFKADNQSKTYDGSALSASNTATLTSGSLVSGHAATFTCSGTITNVGSVTKTLSSVTIKSGTTDVTSNYSITKSNGTLTVSNASFTVSAPNQTYTYNGSAQGAAITVSGLKGSQTATIKYGTTSGTYDTTTVPKITNANEDKTIYWQVTAPNHAPQTGSYTITMNQANGTGSVTMSGWTYGGAVTNPSPSSSTNGTSNVTYTWYNSSKTQLSAKPTSTSSVGTYYVKATFAATTNYKAYTTDYVSFTISNASFTVSAPNQTYTYNGSAQGAAITVSGLKGSQTATIKYGTTSGTYDTTTTPKITNANEDKTIYWQVTAPNHAPQTGSYTITMNKANGSCTVSLDNWTYGSPKNPSASSTTNSGASVTYTYYKSDKTTSLGATKPTNVGTYYVTATFAATTNYNACTSSKDEFVISKRTVTITAPTKTDRTYNGSAQTIFGAGSCTTGGTMYYSDTNKTFSTSTWTTSLPYTQKTTAGTYTLYYYCYVSDTSNNTGTGINTIKSVSAVIGKKATTAPTLTAGSKTTYDGSAVYAKAASASGNPAGKIYYGSSSGATTYSIDVTAGSTTASNLSSMGRTDVGTTTIYAFFRPTDTTNYADSSVVSTTAKVTNKATGYLTATTTNRTYNGSAQTIGTISTNSGSYYFGLGSSTTSAPTSWGSANTALSATSAGTYYVWAKCDASTNYNAVAAKYIGTVTISKRTVTITAPTKTDRTYSGSAQTIFAAGSCTTGGTMYYSDTNKTFSTSTWSTSVPTPKQTNAGTYTLYYYCYVSDTSNNTGTGINTIKSISATIGKKATTAPTLTAGSKTTYDGSTVYAKAASASSNPAGTIYYGESSGATTYSITASTTAANLTKMGQTNVGTTTIYAFFRPTDTANYADSSVVSTTVKVTNKANGSITFSPANKSVQCKNSSTQMTALDIVTCTSATGATGTVTYTLNTGSTTLSNCSLIGTKLTVLKDTPVGEYTISITAKSADTTNYKSASTTSEFTLEVLADTLGDPVGTLSISDSSTKLSAGADTRTITWGAVHQTWTHGGENKYPEVTATLTQSCSNNIANTYVTIDNTSYTNNSSTTESTLTKKSYNNFAHTAGAAFTYTLKLGDVVIERLRITAEANTATTTDTGITAYGTPTIAIGDGITAAGGSATVTCTVKNTMGTKTVFNSGYTTTSTKEVNGSASWSIVSQTCAGGGLRFTKSGNTLVHSTMGTNEGIDTASLRAVNDGDTTKATSIGKGVINYKRHTLTGMNVLYNNALPSNGSTSSPNVTYSTSYVYLSGASGSTTSGNTLSSIGVGTTFTKTFSIEPSISGVIPRYASIDSSTGVITWTENTTVLTRSVNILCEGVLTSQGLETNKSVLSLVSQTGNTSSTYNTQIQFVNTAALASNLSYEIYVNGSKFYTTKANESAGSLVSGLFDTQSTNIEVRAKNNGNIGLYTLKVTFSGSGGSVTSMNPASGSTSISSSTSSIENYTSVSLTISRNDSVNCIGAVQISISKGNIIV